MLLSVYCFTEHDWHICSSALKTTDTTWRVSSLRHTPWTDDVLYDYTFAEAEEVFADELGVPKPGQLIEPYYYLQQSALLVFYMFRSKHGPSIDNPSR
jgi:hypothetical protein